jgi:hypothetical protein
VEPVLVREEQLDVAEQVGQAVAVGQAEEAGVVEAEEEEGVGEFFDKAISIPETISDYSVTSSGGGGGG